MTLFYQGYAYIKKSTAGERQYWKCQHTKPLNCRAGITHITNSNKFKITGTDHTHPIITERRRPGEYKALMEKIKTENL